MRTKAFNILCLMLMLAIPFSSFGADFIVDDIHYNIIGDNSVEVTYSSVSKDYYGNIKGYYGSGRWKTFVILPETVTDPNTGIEYTVTAIGDYAFTKSYPRFISIPNTVTSIGCQAFYLCENLSYINIPASVTSIGSKAFGYHTSSICINGYFTTDDYAFSSEQKKRVIIGPNLAKVSNLTGKDMYVLSTTPPERSKIPSNSYVNLHVPPGCSSAYFMSEAWGNAYTIQDDAVAYDKFEIDRHEMTLAAGEKGKIKLTMSPSTSLPRNWISTDPDVATISYTGEVTAKKEGKTTIIVYSADRYQLCEVTVTAGSVSAYFDIHSLSLNVGQMEIITPTFTTTVTDWKVESSRPDVVAMQIYNNDRIRLLALKPGMAKITVSSPTVDIKSDTCVVTVNGEVLDADLTGDGAVNVGDISELYRLILNGESPADADLNLDGQVNAGDVSTLYGIILGQ